MSATTVDRSGLDEAQRHGLGDAQAGLTRRTRDELVTFLAEQGVRVSASDNDAVFERYCEAYDQRSRQEDLVDAGSEMSFPASDPPSYMAGASVAGAPPENADECREGPNTAASDSSQLKKIQETDGTGGHKSDAPGGGEKPNAARRD
ncbi:hypothetical protein ABEG18_21770 [Alsobacter sp. KACC 23698]|uniref:Uncharacterized protein n=1 Tax=Alsobacter sp. KACC 23698 TaxID=3149229 RepID=A0AAU7JDM9_9HYPH